MIFGVKIAILALIGSLCVCCTGDSVSKKDLFDTTIYLPSCATGFEIVGDKVSNRLIRVTRPWQGDAVVEQSLAIFADEASARGYEGQYIVGRAERVVCMSTSHIAMLELLGKGENIVGLTPKQILEKGISMSFIPEDRLGMGLAPSMSITDNMILKK